MTGNLSILSRGEIDKKQQLEEAIINGIETGKKGFQQAASALLQIEQLSLWRDEADSFDAYRQKFKALLEDLDISDRHLNRIIAAEKCVQMLRPTGLEVPTKERQIRPLTQLKEPLQVQQAYKRALEIAELEGEELKSEHVQKAVEEIKPPKVKLPKPARIPIGTKVKVLPHYADEEFHGSEGVVTQHPNHDRCIVRFDDNTSKLIPDNMLVAVEEIRDFASTKQEAKEQARSLGLRTGLQALPDAPLTQADQEEIERVIALLLRLLPQFSYQQKKLVYEQLIKFGVAA